MNKGWKHLLENVCAVMAALVCVCAGWAEEYSVWDPNGSGTWSDTTRWVDGKLPTDTGNVRISSADAWATDADVDIIKGLTRIRFSGNSSLDLRFAEDHDDFYSNTIMTDAPVGGNKGLLIKSGVGKLVHSSPKAGFLIDRYIVTNGTLELTFSDTNTVYGAYAPGLLSFNKDTPMIKGLEGDGTVTNAYGSSQVKFYDKSEAVHVFSGALAKQTEPSFVNGSHYFTGDCPAASTIRIYDALVGVNSFGMTGVGGSLGASERFWGQGWSTILYLGTGETTDKSFIIGAACRSLTIDAGATGGVTFNGSWSSQESPRVVPLYLQGSNTEVCVYNSSEMYLNGSSTSTVSVVKRGTGTWRFPARNRSGMTGSVCVENGTLEYGSLAEAGAPCSLGLATFTTEPYSDYYDASKNVPWAFRLGTHSTTGTFAYVGTAYMKCQSRLTAVQGFGRVRSVGGAVLNHAGATSADAQGGTLILDGTGTCDNFGNVTNGPGPLVVQKTGSGTWSIGGDVDVAGLDVKEGTLRLNNSTNAYTWYRFTMKELWGDYQMQLSQFGLYNATGEQQNLWLAENPSVYAQPYLLQPGGVQWDHAVTVGGSGARPVTNLFKGAESLCNCYRYTNLQMAPTNTDPSTWMSFTMRLPAGSAPVKYYDIQSHMGNTNGVLMYYRDIRRWTLEGSVDGHNWDSLDAKYFETPQIKNKGKVWYHSDSTTHDESNRGYEIPTAPTGKKCSVGYVKVTGGGTLTADRPIAVSGLRVDAADGGTIENLAFAPSGTIEVYGAGPDTCELPLTFVNPTDLPNVSNWILSMDGSVSASRRVVASGGKLRLVLKGTIIMFR